MKKILLCITFTLCFLLLPGCGKTPQKPSDETNKPESTTQAQSSIAEKLESTTQAQSSIAEKPESTTQAEATALDRLQSSISEHNAMLGVGFIGYIDSESDEKAVRQFVNDSALASEYSFLKELDEVVIEGSELYAFVPAGKTAVITVYYAEVSENGSYIDHKDVPLYTGDAGEAIVVHCNLSEVYSNVLISVKDGANTLEFHPILSMKDGHVAAKPGCYDFTDYEMTEEERAQNASDLLTATDEVRDAMERGMKLLYTGDTQAVDGQQCLLFALGTEHEDQFVREQLYAVADDKIYAYSAVNDSWEPLGAG